LTETVSTRGVVQSGDDCTKCDGRLIVVNTFVVGDERIRYLGCRQCGYRPKNNCQRIPLRFAPKKLSRVFATSSKSDNDTL